MDKITTILVPFDFSPEAEKGLDYAIHFAGSRAHMTLTICYLVPENETRDSDAHFRHIAETRNKIYSAKLDKKILMNPTVPGLLEMQQATHPDLIIMGTAGSDDPDATTHTSQIVMDATCPVIAVPKHADLEEFEIKNIALVLGRNEINDAKRLATLLDVSRKFNSKVHVLTIENEPGTYGYSPTEEQNEELLEYYLENFYADHIYIENEDLIDGICNYVEEKEIDLLSILPQNHVNKGKPSEGKLTKLLTLKTKTPLLAIE